MRFTESPLTNPRTSALRAGCIALPLLLAACASRVPLETPREPEGRGQQPLPATHGPASTLPPPVAARTWAEFKLQAARRMVAADPAGSYTGPVPEPLLAIPVLEVELNGDGSIRRVNVLREPKAGAPETVQMAITAVRRAAPFGDVSRLPKPWLFTEAFLYDEARRFKPRTLDE